MSIAALSAKIKRGCPTRSTTRKICLFYVLGVLDGFRVGGDTTTKICVPDEASVGELALLVSKYLDRYPEKLHNPSQYLVIDALHTAFPCESGPPKK
jgi:hypothetical protein